MGMKKLFGVMEIGVILIKVMVLQKYANVENNPKTYFKYVELTVLQLCLS